MCRPDRLLLTAALLCLIGSRPASADPGRIQAAHPAPQDIPPAPDGGLTISLRDLSSPTRLEPQLARALRDSKLPGFALTVPGGSRGSGTTPSAPANHTRATSSS